jgi:hypothetical protein
MVQLAIAAIAVTASACAPVYLPNAVHTGVPAGAGEIHAAGYYGTGVGSLNLTAAATDHLVLGAAYSFDFMEDSLAQDKWPQVYHVGHRFWEAGAGWSWRSDNMKVMLIAGFGMGHTVTISDDSTGTYIVFGRTGEELYRIVGDFNRLSIQTTIALPTNSRNGTPTPAAGSGRSSVSEAGLALRASYLWFDRLDRSPLSALRPRLGFLEPVVFVRLGSASIQGELQFGLLLKTTLDGGDVDTQMPIFNLGLHGVLYDLW